MDLVFSCQNIQMFLLRANFSLSQKRSISASTHQLFYAGFGSEWIFKKKCPTKIRKAKKVFEEIQVPSKNGFLVWFFSGALFLNHSLRTETAYYSGFLNTCNDLFWEDKIFSYVAEGTSCTFLTGYTKSAIPRLKIRKKVWDISVFKSRYLSKMHEQIIVFLIKKGRSHSILLYV
jgi:hypothetical protein